MTHRTPRQPVPLATPPEARRLWRQRLSVLVAFVVTLTGGAQAQQGEQLNVLFISVDDLSTAVGFMSEEPGNVLQTLYPDPDVRAQVRAVLTPNLDALAASGAPFAHAYAASAICAPSRASLMTGVRTHVSGFYGGMGFRDNEILADVATIPEYLRAHGYYSAGVGKIYHSPASVTDEMGAIVDDRADILRSWETWVSRSLSPNAPTTESRWSPNEDRFRFGVNDKPLEEQTDYQNADVVAQALRTGRGTLLDEITGEPVTIQIPGNRPFFLGVGLYRPHLPWIMPDEIRDLFDPDDIALTEALRQTYFDDTDDLSPEGQLQVYRVDDEIVAGRAKLLYEHGESIASGGAIDAWKAAVQHYLASIAQADRIVGHLLASLDAGPYADNTVVVLWGDHGWHLGEKTWFGKTTLWEESAQTTLIIRAPGLVDQPGTLRQQPVSLVDVFPTLLTLTGAPALDGLGGADLWPLLTDADAPAVSTALTTMGLDDHTLRTDLFRYVRFNEDLNNAELYDVVADPDERVNLIDDPAFSGVRLDMETRMDMALSQQAVPVSAPPLPTPAAPEALALDAPAPNPSAAQTSITYRLDARGQATLALYDALGRRVAVLDAGLREAGDHRVRIPTAPLAPGVYVVRLHASGGAASQRLVVAR